MSRKTREDAAAWVEENYGLPQDEVDWIDIVDGLLTRTRWISVEDELPKPRRINDGTLAHSFVVARQKPSFAAPCIAACIKRVWRSTDGRNITDVVTHWAYIPDTNG